MPLVTGTVATGNHELAIFVVENLPDGETGGDNNNHHNNDDEDNDSDDDKKLFKKIHK